MEKASPEALHAAYVDENEFVLESNYENFCLAKTIVRDCFVLYVGRNRTIGRDEKIKLGPYWCAQSKLVANLVKTILPRSLEYAMICVNVGEKEDWEREDPEHPLKLDEHLPVEALPCLAIFREGPNKDGTGHHIECIYDVELQLCRNLADVQRLCDKVVANPNHPRAVPKDKWGNPIRKKKDKPVSS